MRGVVTGGCMFATIHRSLPRPSPRTVEMGGTAKRAAHTRVSFVNYPQERAGRHREILNECIVRRRRTSGPHARSHMGCLPQCTGPEVWVDWSRLPASLLLSQQLLGSHVQYSHLDSSWHSSRQALALAAGNPDLSLPSRSLPK